MRASPGRLLRALLLGGCLLVAAPASAQTGTPAPAPAPPPGPTPGTAPAATAPAVTVPPPGAVTPGPPTPPAGTVPAQTLPTFTLFDPGRVRPAATFELHPTFSLSEEYSDNWFLAPRNKQDNWRTLATVGLTLGINGARTRGSISGSYGVSYDTVDDEFSADRAISLTGQVAWEATPLLTLTVTDSLTRSDDPSRADDLRLRREREEYFSNLFSVAADYRLPTLTTSASYLLSTFFNEGGSDTISHTISVGATKSFMERNYVSGSYAFVYSDTSDDGGSTTGHSVALSVARDVNPQTTVGLSGSFSYREGTEAVQDDYTIATVAVFGSYRLPGIWAGSLALGYSGFDPKNGATDGAPYASASFSYQLARATFSLTADSGFAETFATGDNLGVVQTWGVTASLGYPFTPFLSGTASVFYRENSFGRGTTTQVRGDEDTYGGSLALSTLLRSWLTLSLSYDYTKADSSIAADDYTENRVVATLSASF